MPRHARLDAPDTLHHVMVRGIERTAIFHEDADRTDFLARLEHLAAEGVWTVYAWALLPNHAHLLVRTAGAPLAVGMRRLLTGYVVNFNRRHTRVGHLFQNGLGRVGPSGSEATGWHRYDGAREIPLGAVSGGRRQRTRARCGQPAASQGGIYLDTEETAGSRITVVTPNARRLTGPLRPTPTPPITRLRANDRKLAQSKRGS